MPDAVRAHEDMRTGAAALLDRIGPSVLLTHSFGGGFGWLALSERPSLVKALVAVEPAGPPFVDHPALGSFRYGLTPVPLAFGPGPARRSSTACRSRWCRPRAPASSRPATHRGVPAVVRGGG